MMDWPCIDPLDPVDLLVFSDVLEAREDLRGAAALRYLVEWEVRPYNQGGLCFYFLHEFHNKWHSRTQQHWLYRACVLDKANFDVRTTVVCYDPSLAERPQWMKSSIILAASPNPPLALLQWVCQHWRLPPEEDV